MNKEIIIKIQNLKKEFDDGSEKLVIFEDANLEIYKGEKVAIIGPSGSGKSTLLSLIAGMDKPTSGEIIVGNKKIQNLSENELSKYRNQEISMIFQSFELIGPFTAIENIMAPLDIRNTKNAKENKSIAWELIQKIKLEKRENHYPNTLSGGEKQRVAIARALSANTEIILADEPTGSLDRKTGEIVLELLLSEVKIRNKTLFVITHDTQIAEKMDRIFELKDKKLYEIKNA
ncbi:MAG TPA: ABC transporter ATP-binding protein [Candidatus Paceibacterota bacterium]|nr:ABC transporter ATP-binding protein [Candidatus Paceibacterota bacterium]HMP18930.1 ABC transporter ATP-binding protein [Candidatus Paceibacterota bacterium]HMP85093.1 ABC transporter ATP-binding protein [Candidatus Paceibacterota bacterium]